MLFVGFGSLFVNPDYAALFHYNGELAFSPF